jgi:hypothetical protein
LGAATIAAAVSSHELSIPSTITIQF